MSEIATRAAAREGIVRALDILSVEVGDTVVVRASEMELRARLKRSVAIGVSC